MNARRLAAGDSHLYPGVRLAGTPANGFAHWQAGDPVLIEFADLSIGEGRIEAAAANGWLLQIFARSTAKGAAIPAQTWWLEPQPHEPGLLCVRRT